MSQNNPNSVADMQQCLQNMELIGDVWVLAIVMVLEREGMGFNQLRQHIDGMNSVTLNTRLKKMREAKLIDRQPSLIHKQAVVYSLTSKGRVLLPIVHEMKKAALKLMRQ